MLTEEKYQLLVSEGRNLLLFTEGKYKALFAEGKGGVAVAGYLRLVWLLYNTTSFQGRLSCAKTTTAVRQQRWSLASVILEVALLNIAVLLVQTIPNSSMPLYLHSFGNDEVSNVHQWHDDEQGNRVRTATRVPWRLQLTFRKQ